MRPGMRRGVRKVEECRALTPVIPRPAAGGAIVNPRIERRRPGIAGSVVGQRHDSTAPRAFEIIPVHCARARGERSKQAAKQPAEGWGTYRRRQEHKTRGDVKRSEKCRKQEPE